MSAARPAIGERGRRFTLDLPTETPDGFGGVIRSFQPGPQLWGAMTLLSADERVRADRPEDIATHRVSFRYRAGVTPAARLSLGPRRFRIRNAVDPDGAGRLLVCFVEEIAP